MEEVMYIAVEQDGTPILGEVQNREAAALSVYSATDLAGDSQNLQKVTIPELKAMISAAADFDYVRLKSAKGSHTHTNAEILEHL